MATLPDAFSLGERATPQPSGATASYDPPNFRQVGMVGQAVSGAGRDMEEAANIIASTNERQDNLVAQDAANQQAVASVQAQFDPKTGWANAKEGQAVGQRFIDDNMSKFTSTSGMIRDNLENDNQKKIFDAHAKVAELRYKSALFVHQADQTDKFNTATENSTINNALQSMARDPQNDLNFQTGLVQINGTIDQRIKRLGLPPEQATDLKTHYLTAAYTSRILATMDGVPGVIQANPYAAEALFKQVQDKLAPEAQTHLALQVQKGVQGVQQRDIASAIIYGKPPTAPNAIAPGATGKPLQAVVMALESGGDPNAVGPMTRSGERALGSMQVMPATAKNPGYGVAPAKDNSPEELARVGRDYLGAMSARYEDPALVLAAYNAGPAQVDKWLGQYGDPRSGQISAADWAAKIPFAETQKYVVSGLKKMNADSGNPGAPIQAPTANNLKTDLYQRVQYARTVAEQQYPGDTAYADAVASRVEGYGRQVIANQQGMEAGARDQLFAGLAGSQPNGSDKPTSIDQLLADPSQKANWDKATPETKLAIQAHFKNGAGDPPRTADSQRILYAAMGRYSNDREGFANEDLAALIPVLPHADADKLFSLQVAARNKQDRDADKQVNLQHALTISLDYALKPIGIGVPTKDTPAGKRAQYDQFTGRLSEAMDNFKAVNGKVPSDSDIVKIAKGLTASVSVPGAWFGSNSKPGFALTPEEEAKASIPLTPDQKADITKTLTTRYGFAPSERTVQQAALLMSLHPNDKEKLRQFDQTMRARK